MHTENTSQRIAVTGATGRVGAPLGEILEQRGHDVVPIARSQGVDVVSGEGLDEALVGVEIIIDTATPPTAHADDAIDMLYVKDCARAIALLQTTARLAHSTYNVGSGHATSNAEVVAAIKRAVPGAELPLEPGRSPHSAVAYLDTTRLQADTDFEPEYALDRAVADHVSWSTND